MAASMNWCKKLNQHKLFENLRQDIKKSVPQAAHHSSKSLITLNDSDLYVYNPADRSILYTNLKSLTAVPVAVQQDTVTLTDQAPDQAILDRYQKLLPTCPPVHDVESIQFNLIGTRLALVGRRGISVITLPQRWGKFLQFEGGKDKVICSTILIGERLFVSDVKLQVLQADWHPGSLAHSHIAVLTSDNYLRIFNINEPEEAEQAIFLGDKNSQDELPVFGHSTLNTPAVLGETAVAFDIGLPLPLEKKVRERHDVGDSNHGNNSSTEQTWPVFILRGSGDVCVLYTALHLPGPLQTQVSSPLSMYPPAEDNYGTDACAILCLPTAPPVLSIATCSGNVYHCAALHKEQHQDQDDLPHSSVLSKQYESLPNFCLFIYENVELELSLTTEFDLVDSDYTCPIRLQKDPMIPERYHCLHAAGVHTVMLPWLYKFKQFCEEDDSDFLLQGCTEQPAIVEHLVCTQPLPSSPPAPILGIGLTTDRMLGFTLLVLSGDFECIAIPLRYTYQPPPAPLLSGSPSKKTQSPLRKLHKQPFDDHIRQILRRNTTNPLLRATGDVGPQECLQLLGRVTQVFRQEYLQKFETAQQEILQRVSVLEQQKELQQQDVQDTLSERADLRSNAESLAEQYEEASENQRQLMLRLGKVLIAIESRVPVLSDLERNMQKELKEIKEQLHQLKVNLLQIQQKKDYQAKVITQKQMRPGTSPGLSKQQLTSMRNMLKKEGDEISDLVKKVNDLKVTLDT